MHKRFSIPKTDKILLTVGRLGKEKNFPFLINMLKKLEATNPNAHLVIAGQGWELNNLENLASRLGLSDKVHFTRKKVEAELMKDVYADSDVFVFSSTTETQGMVVLEAAASGLPLVVVKDSAYDNLAIDGKTGFSVPANQKTFAQKVSLLLKNKDLCQQFGKQAREVASKNFEGRRLTQEIINYYKEVQATYEPGGKVFRRINRAVLAPFFRATGTIYRFLNS